MSGIRMESTRVAFLETLTELMESDPKTVVIFADSVKVFRVTLEFLQKFAGWVFDVGIAEQTLSRRQPAWRPAASPSLPPRTPASSPCGRASRSGRSWVIPAST